MDSAGPQHRRNQLVGVTIEDQQGVVHVLPIEGMIGGPFLGTIGRVIGAIEVQENPLRHAVTLAFTQIELDEGDGQAVAGATRHGIVEAGEGGLAGEGGAALGQAATDELEQGVMAQGIGVVLILIATGDLEDALADEGLQGMLAGATAPLGNEGGDQRAQAERGVRFGQPGQAAIGREATAIEGGLQGQCGRSGESIRRCGTITQHGSLLVMGSCQITPPYHELPC